jgi:hypothetical protein
MEEIWEGHLSFEPEEVVALDDEQVLAAVRTGGREGSRREARPTDDSFDVGRGLRGRARGSLI